jgi:Glutathione S-transferase, N-terminal domain
VAILNCPPLVIQNSFHTVCYSEKVRWALDYKGITHHRQVLGADYLIRAWRATGRGTLPILFLDGRAIGDSTNVIPVWVMSSGRASSHCRSALPLRADLNRPPVLNVYCVVAESIRRP